jgi:hypothetical protein
MWPTRDTPGGVVLHGMPGREAVVYLIPSEGRVQGETMHVAGTW